MTEEKKDVTSPTPPVERAAPAPKPPAEEKEVEVRIVLRQGDATLVEWVASGGKDLRRAIVPTEVIDRGRVPRSQLEQGIPYGDNWEKHITITADAGRVARALRRRGIFTLLDADNSPAGVQKAFCEVILEDMATMLQSVRDAYTKEAETERSA